MKSVGASARPSPICAASWPSSGAHSSSAAESCPIFPGDMEKVHHSFQDPPALVRNARSEEEALGHYRRVRDEIRAFIETLPEALNRKEPST